MPPRRFFVLLTLAAAVAFATGCNKSRGGGSAVVQPDPVQPRDPLAGDAVFEGDGLDERVSSPRSAPSTGDECHPRLSTMLRVDDGPVDTRLTLERVGNEAVLVAAGASLGWQRYQFRPLRLVGEGSLPPAEELHDVAVVEGPRAPYAVTLTTEGVQRVELASRGAVSEEIALGLSTTGLDGIHVVAEARGDRTAFATVGLTFEPGAGDIQWLWVGEWDAEGRASAQAYALPSEGQVRSPESSLETARYDLSYGVPLFVDGDVAIVRQLVLEGGRSEVHIAWPASGRPDVVFDEIVYTERAIAAATNGREIVLAGLFAEAFSDSIRVARYDTVTGVGEPFTDLSLPELDDPEFFYRTSIAFDGDSLRLLVVDGGGGGASGDLMMYRLQGTTVVEWAFVKELNRFYRPQAVPGEGENDFICVYGSPAWVRYGSCW